MRVLLRHTQSRSFYGRRDTWVTEPAEAWNFQSSANAIQFVSEMKLQSVEIVLWFDDPLYNMVLPVKLQPPSQPEPL